MWKQPWRQTGQGVRLGESNTTPGLCPWNASCRHLPKAHIISCPSQYNNLQSTKSCTKQRVALAPEWTPRGMWWVRMWDEKEREVLVGGRWGREGRRGEWWVGVGDERVGWIWISSSDSSKGKTADSSVLSSCRSQSGGAVTWAANFTIIDDRWIKEKKKLNKRNDMVLNLNIQHIQRITGPIILVLCNLKKKKSCIQKQEPQFSLTSEHIQ